MPKIFFWIGIFYPIIFVLLYNEQTDIGGIKVSHLWKITLIYVLGVALFVRRKKFRVSPEVKVVLLVGFIYSCWPLMSALLLDQPQSALFFVGQRLLPFLLLAFMCTVNITERQGNRMLYHLCVFFVVAALPFLMGILSPLEVYVGANILDIEGVVGFVGIHQKPHDASILFMLISIIALITASESKGVNRLLWGVLGGMLVFILLKTYVRSGMLGLVTGMLGYLLFYRAKKIPLYLIVSLIPLVLVLIGAINIPGLSERILGENKYQSTSDLNSMSSGRVLIWESSLQTFEESSLFEKVLGVGRDNMMNENERRIGFKLFAHSGYIDALVSFGVIGLFLYCILLYAFFKAVADASNLRYKYIGTSLVFSMVAYSLFQSTDFPIALMIVMIVIRLAMPEFENKKELGSRFD